MFEEVRVSVRRSCESVFRSIVKSRRSGKFSNTALFVETDFESTPKVKAMRDTKFVSYQALIFSKILAWDS